MKILTCYWVTQLSASDGHCAGLSENNEIIILCDRIMWSSAQLNKGQCFRSASLGVGQYLEQPNLVRSYNIQCMYVNNNSNNKAGRKGFERRIPMISSICLLPKESCSDYVTCHSNVHRKEWTHFSKAFAIVLIIALYRN